MQSREELLQELRELQTKCAELVDKIEYTQDEEPKFERAKNLECYFMISFADGKARADTSCECYDELDNSRYDNNNYFKTSERTQEVADKINFLLKLERLHDTLCPDFVPDWDDFNSCKYMILYDHDHKIYKYMYCYSTEQRTLAFFPSEKIAQKVCDILNKERENNDKS